MKLATREEIAQVRDMTMKLNEFLKDFSAQRGVDLIDFKVEYGKDNYGNIILPTKFYLIPAVSGISKPAKSLTRTVSAK